MSTKQKRVLVFTGGGLAPALNPTLGGVIAACQERKLDIVGGLFGWSSLSEGGRLVDLNHLDPASLRSVGGTILRSSRTNPFATPDGPAVVQKKIREHRIDCVVAIGGDDTLGAARKLFDQFSLPIVGIPKTIDNDLQATYWTPGYPSAAYYTAQYCYEIRTDAAFALSRIFVIEVLGRQSGWLTAAASYGLADVIIPPEQEIKFDHLLTVLEKRYRENGNYATVVMSEEAHFDRPLERIAQDQPDHFNIQRNSFGGLSVRQAIADQLGIGCKALFPGNFMQTGKPVPIDAEYAERLGRHAVELVAAGKFGRMASLKCPVNSAMLSIIDVPLAKAVGKVRFLDPEYFDFDALQVMPAFRAYADLFLGSGIINAAYEKQVRRLHEL